MVMLMVRLCYWVKGRILALNGVEDEIGISLLLAMSNPFALSVGGGAAEVEGSKAKIKTVGGGPTASYFSCLGKKSNQKKPPPVCRPSGSLGNSQTSGAAQLALAGHTNHAPLRSSNSARLNLRSFANYRGGAQGNEKQKS
jgi:hypothetical protein